MLVRDEMEERGIEKLLFKGIKGKLIVLVTVLIALVAVSMAFFSIYELNRRNEDNIAVFKNQLLQENKDKLKGFVDNTYNIVLEYERLVKAGKMSVEEAQEGALSSIEKMRYDEGQGYFWIQSARDPKDPVMIMHPVKPELNGTGMAGVSDLDAVEKVFYENKVYAKKSDIIENNVEPSHPFVKMNQISVDEGSGYVKYYWPKVNGEEGVGYPKLSYVKYFNTWKWVIGTGFYLDTMEKKVAAMSAASNRAINVTKMNITLAALACLAVGMLLAIWFAGRITNPLMGVVSGVKRVAGGDLTRELHVRSGDEIGVLARAFNEMVRDLNTVVSEIKANSEKLTSHSWGIASSSEELSATAEEVAGTTSEVSSTAGEGAENAKRVTDESGQVYRVAEKGNEAVRQTIDKIHSISRASESVAGAVKSLETQSKKIGEIIETITNIADQTNLLALNAAIEAARAGEQGKGFAVVAEEVRGLAEQSAEAANEIAGLIQEIQAGVGRAVNAMEEGSTEVQEGVQIAHQAGTSLDEIMQAVKKNTEVISDIAAGIAQTSEGTQQLAASNEGITSTVQELSGSAQELAHIAGELQNTVARFTISSEGQETGEDNQ